MCMFASSSLEDVTKFCLNFVLCLTCQRFLLVRGDGDDLSSWSWVLCQVPLWTHYGSVPGPTMSCAGPGVGEPKSWCPGVKQTGPGLLHRSECTNRSALAQPRQQQMVKMSVEICSYAYIQICAVQTFLFLQFTLKVIHGVCMYCAPNG